MTNLEYFINGEYHRDFDKKVDEDKELFDHQIDSLLRIAIMHAQFESIHPFLDGNGRLGRILIVLMAIKEKIMEAPLFFADCWQNDQNINERIDVLVVFQKK